MIKPLAGDFYNHICIKIFFGINRKNIKNNIVFIKNMNKNFIIYLCVINIITFLAFGQDKWKAKNDEWRTSEKTLLGFACIGGSVGAWIGMHVFHHKTRKNEFRYGIPAIFAVQVILTLIRYSGILR